jgi:hypothetical protein
MKSVMICTLQEILPGERIKEDGKGGAWERREVQTDTSVGKPEGIRPFETNRHRYDNIKMDLEETDSEDVEWLRLICDRHL